MSISRDKNPALSQELEHALDALAFLYQPGDIMEIRALEVGRTTDRSGYTLAGYFNIENTNAIAAAIRRVDGYATGVYAVLNKVNPVLQARANNRLAKLKNVTTDADILEWRWLYIDCDPVRPAGISSSDPEHAAALIRAQEIRQLLDEEGWPEPLYADSGNGAHLLYRLQSMELHMADVLVKACLQALAARFSDDVVNVDVNTANRSRICKLYGTLTRKGDSMPDRPHRRSRILFAPERAESVPVELIDQLAAEVPNSQKAKVKTFDFKSRNGGTPLFDIELWLANSGFNIIKGPEPYSGGRRWTLDVCPFNQDHKKPVVIELASGALVYRCLHKSCEAKDWKALRDLVEPNRTPDSGPGRMSSDDEGPSSRRHASEQEEAAAENGVDLPIIAINNRNTFELAQEALDALRRGPCEFFGRGFDLVQLERTDERDRLGKRTVMKPVTMDSLLVALTESARFVKTDPKGNLMPARPQNFIARDILNFGAHRWQLPLLAAIAETPVLLPDGRILAQPGYDRESQLYYDGPPLRTLPDQPTKADAVAAAKYLRENLLCDFPAKDQTSLANLYAALFTPLVRHAVNGLVPLCGITAPVAGSGKTTIAQLTSILGRGFHAATTSMPTTEEEMNKLLISILRQNPSSILVFDNSVGLVGQPSLDMALTSAIYSGRLLGVNQEITIPHSLTIYVTGNNIGVRADTARRTYWVRLLPEHAPAFTNRRYKHPRIDQWALEHRMDLLWNFFLMCRAWHVAGRRQSSGPRVAGFEGWSEMLGGILEYAGVKGFLASFQADADAASQEQSDWAAFLVELYGTQSDRQFTAGELTANLQHQESLPFRDLREAAPRAVMEAMNKGFASAKYLGGLLSEQCERIYLVTEEGKTPLEYKLVTPGKARSGVLKFRVLQRDPKKAWPSL
ncbi:MAG: hypothetical protein WB676_21265 [Bryobacteraceae bacterium]